MNIKYIAVFACIIMTVMMVAPLISPVKATNPAVMNVIQYKYYDTQDALFSALVSGDVDIMGWPLTKAEYTTALTNTGIVVETLPEAGEFEMAFNNNLTDGIKMSVRSPMNYTDFRNAMNCLIDEDGVIAGPILGGFATRDYVTIPQPLMNGYVNPAITGSSYPWAYNVTHALQILYDGGWYSHTVYPTFASLVTAYGGGTGALSTAGGTANGVVYSGNDPHDQGWDIIDTRTGPGGPTANSAVANTALAPLVGYVRSGDARKNLGDMFVANLKAIGCPYTENYEATLTALRPYVLDAQTYDWATLGYGTMGAPPNWFYSECTAVGIYSGGGNPYLIQDDNMTHWADTMYFAPDQASYQAASNNVQDILVMESELVSVYTPATYCAYKTGMLGQIDVLGEGTQNGAQLGEWITLDSRKTNTIVYTGNPANTPASNIIVFGVYNPPDMLNPIFSDEVFDFQVLDQIFTYPMGGSPYTILPGSAITGVPAGEDLPWMAYAWQQQLIPAQDGSSGQWTNVTYWIRSDITWQDGVPMTVQDINYTIWANAFYGTSWTNSGMVLMCNASNNYLPYFTAHGDYCFSVLVSNPSFLNIYSPNYEIVPQHIYKYILPNNFTAAETGTATDGLVGLWPGQAAVAGNIQSGAPFTLAQLTSEPATTLVGTGPWKYRQGSNTGFVLGGGITLDAYSGFFLTIAPGSVAFKYTWLNPTGAMPQGGYYKIGLADLVYLANAYGTTGTPPSAVSISSVPGAAHSWNPAADLAAPSGVIGLSDLVTLALHYGWYFGNYSYNAPYPPSEIANGGP